MSAKAMKCRWRCPDGVLGAEDLAPIAAEFERTYRGALRPQRTGCGARSDQLARGGQRTAAGYEFETFRAISSKRSDAAKVRAWRIFPRAMDMVETAIYDRYALKPGMTFAGPAIVEERESTLIIGARGRARVDERAQCRGGVKRV